MPMAIRNWTVFAFAPNGSKSHPFIAYCLQLLQHRAEMGFAVGRENRQCPGQGEINLQRQILDWSICGFLSGTELNEDIHVFHPPIGNMQLNSEWSLFASGFWWMVR